MVTGVVDGVVDVEWMEVVDLRRRFGGTAFLDTPRDDARSRSGGAVGGVAAAVGRVHAGLVARSGALARRFGSGRGGGGSVSVADAVGLLSVADAVGSAGAATVRVTDGAAYDASGVLCSAGGGT